MSATLEPFKVRWQLKDESKKKIISQLPIENANKFNDKPEKKFCEKNKQDPKYAYSSGDHCNALVYVYEWMDNNESIFGYGCNRNGDAAILKVLIKPGLFVVTTQYELLTEYAALHKYETIQYPEMKYRANNFTLLDLFHDPSVAELSVLVKIVTSTVQEADELYRKIKSDNDNTYKFVSVSLYWDVTKQIMYELMVQQHAENRPIDLASTMGMWFDEHLNLHATIPAPSLPLITFDIETVSSDPNRVPLGSAIDDVLYTISIHHVHTNVLYTLVFLPIKNMTAEQICDVIKKDGYDQKPEDGCINILEGFRSEKDLLIRTMQLLTVPKKLHFLVGFNSMSYDMKFLKTRCTFYNIHQNDFLYQDAISFMPNQIHLDLYRIVRMQYQLPKYTLNAVAKELVNDTKTGVSAVALRYSFHRMLISQKFFEHHECDEKNPSVRDTLYYNNYDTLLVSKIFAKIKAEEFLMKIGRWGNIPLSSLNANFNKMKYQLYNKCLVTGLKQQVFLGLFKPSKVTANIPVPCDHENVSDFLERELDLITPIALSTTNNSGKKRFPGGANFCLGEYDVDNVQAYDKRIAYPLLIQRLNISDETSSVLPADVLLSYFPLIKNKSEFKTFDYLKHSGNNKSETALLYSHYIYDGMYCGGEFPFNECELKKRHKSSVIIIWCLGRRGVLRDIVAEFNVNREETKTDRKFLEGVVTLIDATIDELEAAKWEEDDEGDDDDDDDEEVTDNDDNEAVVNSKTEKEPKYHIDPTYINLENNSIKLNRSAIDKTDDPIKTLQTLKIQVQDECDRLQNWYMILKATVSSIYGCVGEMSPVTAALITSLVRSTLLQAAQYMRQKGFMIYYIDTDSIFAKHSTITDDMSPELNLRFPHMEIEMKTIPRCIFVQKKTYYKIEEGVLTYGQNVNGPKAWKNCVYFFFEQSSITYNDDIETTFCTFFNNIYDKLLAFDHPTEEWLAEMTQTITLKSEYKTMTVSAKLKTYLNKFHPALAGSYKQNVFYYMGADVTKPCLRPIVELKSISDLSHVNFFKYYQNMFKTIFNLIKTHIHKNNEPYNVTISSKHTLSLMLKSFISVYQTRFPHTSSLGSGRGAIIDGNDDDGDDEDEEDNEDDNHNNSDDNC